MVTERVSISFLFFVRGRTIGQCVEFGFSLRTLLAAFLLRLPQPRQILLRLLSTYLLASYGPTHHGCFVRRCSLFVFPYPSPLCHFTLFSVMAFISTTVVFITLDSLFLLWDEHEDESETVCIVPELTEVTSSDFGTHSFLLLSSSSSHQKMSFQEFLLSSILPSHSSHATLCVFCAGLLTRMSTCTISVCVFLPHGLEMASLPAMFTTLIFKS